jgi:gluconate 2-dehydrogenase gamma chain
MGEVGGMVHPDPEGVHGRSTGASAAAAATVACGAPEGRWRALTNAEATTLAAACDQIVPPDDIPGAAEAGVVEFLDRQLATREKDHLEIWQRGVRGLDTTARQKKGKPFADLAPEEQTALLKDVETGQVPAAAWEGLDSQVFFGRLVRYTMMGYYGDPRHGGNRDHVSWRMLGVPPAPVRGRLHEVPVATPAVRKKEGE